VVFKLGDATLGGDASVFGGSQVRMVKRLSYTS